MGIGRIPLPDGESIPVTFVPKEGADQPAPGIAPGNEPAAGRIQPGAPENPSPVAGAESGAPANSDPTQAARADDEFRSWLAQQGIGLAGTSQSRIDALRHEWETKTGRGHFVAPVDPETTDLEPASEHISQAPDVHPGGWVEGVPTHGGPGEGGRPENFTQLSEPLPGDPLPEAHVTVTRPDGTVQDFGTGTLVTGNIDVSKAVGATLLLDTTLEELDGALVTPDGVWIGRAQLPPTQMVPSVRVEHPDHHDHTQLLHVTYVVAGVNVATDAEWPGGMVSPLIEDVPHHECGDGCVCQLEGQQAINIDLFNQTRNQLRRFVLQRDRGDTGISGTGVVAEGVVFTDGRVMLRWLGERSSIVMWPNMGDVLEVHGHKGGTRLRWLDTAPSGTPHPSAPAAPAE